MTATDDGPRHVHGGQRVATFGARPEEAPAAVVLVHGRGATAESILELAHHLGSPAGSPRGPLDVADLAWLAPQAADHAWYPRSFLAPVESNQPHLDSALERLEGLTEELDRRGVPAARTVLAGFSQGACLVSEFAARHPRRWGAVAAFTGGVVGAPEDGRPAPAQGSLAGTPVFLGAGDPDPHVPWWRVEETAQILGGLGGEVTLRRYPGLGHTVNREELDWLRDRLAVLASG